MLLLNTTYPKFWSILQTWELLASYLQTWKQEQKQSNGLICWGSEHTQFPLMSQEVVSTINDCVQD